MKDGYIEDIGSHDQVYSRNDFYKKTYDMQEKGSDIDEK